MNGGDVSDFGVGEDRGIKLGRFFGFFLRGFESLSRPLLHADVEEEGSQIQVGPLPSRVTLRLQMYVGNF